MTMDAYRFFRAQGETVQRARDLAVAEAEARRRRWSFAWEWDDQAWICDAFGESHKLWCKNARRRRECQHDVLGCVLVYGYEYSDRSGRRDVGPSLWGIIDPTDAYQRVIEAELAQEALAEERTAQQNDTDAQKWMAL